MYYKHMNRLAKNYYSLSVSIVKGLDVYLWDWKGYCKFINIIV